jgi:pimeloyl-ACP methyl ester carboxylesterase
MRTLGRLSAHGIELETLWAGAGHPVLLLHGMSPLDPAAPVVDLLAAHAKIVAPSHPGFGGSPRPAAFDTIYDLVHLYRDVLDHLLDETVTLLGLSFGGWLAAEIAVLGHPRVGALVLVDAVGIKVGDRETPDILDVFNTAPSIVRERTWHDPAGWAPDYDAMSDEALVAHARNREALCLYAWDPYMYNPQLARWLGRIAVPTLVLWGASDQIVTPAYGHAYSALIPGARFELVDAAGHHPHLEQPEAFVARVVSFLEEVRPCRPGT